MTIAAKPTDLNKQTHAFPQVFFLWSIRCVIQKNGKRVLKKFSLKNMVHRCIFTITLLHGRWLQCDFKNIVWKNIHLWLFKILLCWSRGILKLFLFEKNFRSHFYPQKISKELFCFRCLQEVTAIRQTSFVCLNDYTTGQKKIHSIKPYELLSVLRNYTICEPSI